MKELDAWKILLKKMVTKRDEVVKVANVGNWKKFK